MRYYVCEHKNSDIKGPCTVDDLAAGVSSGIFSSDFLASSDLGDSLASLRAWRNCDWFLIADIPELKRVFRPLQKMAAQPRRVTIFSVTSYMLFSVWSIYYVMKVDHRWSGWLILMVTTASTVDTTLQYVQQKKHKSQVA